MNNNEWFVIKDLPSLINYSRSLIFNTFGKLEEEVDIDNDNLLLDKLSKKEIEELDSILSYEESLIIVKSKAKQQKHKKTNEIRYLLNDELFMAMLESLNDRMTSNLLNNLVNRGLVETAYDSDVDDFIFWVKDEYKENKPETD